jgi:hypothetical protein
MAEGCTPRCRVPGPTRKRHVVTSPAHPAPSRARRARAAALAAVVLASATVVVVATTGSEPAAAGPAPVMRGYVPLPTNDFQGYLESVNSAADTTISFTVGITNAAAGATIYYDHHEDGFEADIANPSQATTLVLGDGNAANGNAGTYCTACAGDLLPQGAPLIMRSSIPTPRNPANRFFDGGDKVASTRGITITAGGFSMPLNSVLSGVVSAYDTTKYGTRYTVPVGEDTPFPATTTDAFSYTGASIMAGTAATVVEVDTDGDGDTDRTQTVGEGRSLFVDGGLAEGATITASAPVQVHLLTGRRLSDYEARSFTLYPDEVLSNDYLSPAGSGRTSFRTVNYLFNPGSTPLVVTPTCTGCSGTITVPAGASAAFHSPTNQAVRFSSTGGRFIAIAGVGAQSGAPPGGGTNETRMYDWGFTMLPTSQLTTQVALGWAPGNSAVPPSTSGAEESYDPVWVTTLTPTTIHVDRDGNPATGLIGDADCFGARHDQDIPVAALASTKIFDPDGDMTGARIYTCDGTKIAGGVGPGSADRIADRARLRRRLHDHPDHDDGRGEVGPDRHRRRRRRRLRPRRHHDLRDRHRRRRQPGLHRRRGRGRPPLRPGLRARLDPAGQRLDHHALRRRRPAGGDAVPAGRGRRRPPRRGRRRHRVPALRGRHRRPVGGRHRGGGQHRLRAGGRGDRLRHQRHRADDGRRGPGEGRRRPADVDRRRDPLRPHGHQRRARRRPRRRGHRPAARRADLRRGRPRPRAGTTPPPGSGPSATWAWASRRSWA